MKSTYIFGFILLGLVLCVQTVLSMRYSADDSSYLDTPQYTARDLAKWLMESAQRTEKRNREITNSLLNLPKTMMEAGRK
ncbi:pigment-dispersing hormone peptides [Nilaparvata lugens]|uniref:Pigment dispersing factor n=1 Tax=Nilaparvata lugens TaxID=108931 RepID=U3U7E0_NILLU|nr:pigment-dispersing hormone peptides [Nilaparvata lugens]BAO00970.1 pigment dispersing factor [Nilaparvata lugens]